VVVVVCGGLVKGRCDGVAVLLMVLLWDGRRKKNYLFFRERNNKFK